MPGPGIHLTVALTSAEGQGCGPQLLNLLPYHFTTICHTDNCRSQSTDQEGQVIKSIILMGWGERFVLNDENINDITCSDPPAAEIWYCGAILCFSRVTLSPTLTCTCVREEQPIFLHIKSTHTVQIHTVKVWSEAAVLLNTEILSKHIHFRTQKFNFVSFVEFITTAFRVVD